ncbi:MAG TPA: hypothetical protein PKO15_14480, partial [Fibrobacteria bacterium]|nr:hypothetical protein [Fibrobacteria bacterium]
RQLGGFLADQDVTVHALTFGNKGDIEMRCAIEVARRLGAGHRAIDISTDQFPQAAISMMRTEALASGFSNVLDWSMLRYLGDLPGRLVQGYLFDGLVGGLHIPWAFGKDRKFSFETIFERFNRWGFQPHELEILLAPEYRPLIQEVLSDIKNLYEMPFESPHLNALHFDLKTRQRFHVGSSIWPNSFRSFPCSPIFDRELFEIASSIPSSSLSGRRVQTELLVSRHPHLASVPLDRNNFDSLPVKPAFGDYFRVGVQNKLRAMMRKMSLEKALGESRFYYRIYDFNSAGWRSVRNLGDRDRECLPRCLAHEAVQLFLPKSTDLFRSNDGIIDSSKPKLLIGLAMAARHFQLT